MSERSDYETATKFYSAGIPFSALIMAAMMQAEGANLERLILHWPEIHDQMKVKPHRRTPRRPAPKLRIVQPTDWTEVDRYVRKEDEGEL